MQRIADRAGVDKRMLHYYFADRESLFASVAGRVGDRLLADVEEAVKGLVEPTDVVAAGFQTMWDSVVSDPRLYAVHLGLVAASVTEPGLRAPVNQIRDRYASLILDLAQRTREAGFQVRLEDRALVGLILAGIQGLTMDYLQRGETPELLDSIGVFTAWLTQLAVRP